jgi:hypothetical protein
MSSAGAEYRDNARVCADCAASTQSVIDRMLWLRMRQSWLQLAAKADRWEDGVAQDSGAATTAPTSHRQPQNKSA